ncbi:MAG: hypothetical protein EHM70_04210 [Chloroflexota bacterium]|nr:MAG: hypothetical protein EHM70_04210 [Chloroflexota bacterium]
MRKNHTPFRFLVSETAKLLSVLLLLPIMLVTAFAAYAAHSNLARFALPVLFKPDSFQAEHLDQCKELGYRTDPE